MENTSSIDLSARCSFPPPLTCFLPRPYQQEVERTARLHLRPIAQVVVELYPKVDLLRLVVDLGGARVMVAVEIVEVAYCAVSAAEVLLQALVQTHLYLGVQWVLLTRTLPPPPPGSAAPAGRRPAG